MWTTQRIGTEPRLLTIGDLRSLFRCGRTTAYARVHEEGFPTPVALSGSAHRWWEHEVIAWIEDHRLESSAIPAQRSLPTDESSRPRPATTYRRRAVP